MQSNWTRVKLEAVRKASTDLGIDLNGMRKERNNTLYEMRRTREDELWANKGKSGGKGKGKGVKGEKGSKAWRNWAPLVEKEAVKMKKGLMSGRKTTLGIEDHTPAESSVPRADWVPKASYTSKGSSADTLDWYNEPEKNSWKKKDWSKEKQWEKKTQSGGRW